MDVISVQSRVKKGFVGNTAAVPSLQASGVTAWPVDTIVYAHHPGHGPVTPEVPELPSFDRAMRDALGNCRGRGCLLSGYLANVEQGMCMLDRLDQARRDGKLDAYFLDPVFGDEAEGTYVAPSLVTFFRDHALPQSDIMMPNRYELATLSRRSVGNVAEAVSAARALLDHGPAMIMATSIPAPGGQVANILVTRDDGHLVTVNKLPLRAKGTGDVLSAAFCGLHRQGVAAAMAMAIAVGLVDAVTKDASTRNLNELDLLKVLNSFDFTNKSTLSVQSIETLEE